MILEEKLYINGSLVFPSLEDAATAYRESYLEMAQEKLVQAINNKVPYLLLPLETPISVIEEIKSNGFNVKKYEYYTDGIVDVGYEVSGWKQRVNEEDMCLGNVI